MQTPLTNLGQASTVSMLTSTLAGGAIAALASTATWLSHIPPAHAQVNNADLSCYLHTASGQQFDLSALCAGFDGPQNVVPSAEASDPANLPAATPDAAAAAAAEAAPTADIPALEPGGTSLPPLPN
ncbi:MAG: hypothetical protein AAFP20_18150 [Cyanobacteria bacterium J06614_10]